MRGGRAVFHNLNFRLEAGQVLALEGANGAGKTSCLRMIAGLLPQADGVIEFCRDKNSIITDAEERGAHVGWLGHLDGVKAQLSVAENVAFFAALYAAGDNIPDVLGRVGLAAAAGWPVAYLSAGQRRRLALARLLLARRPLWLLDEPTAALDSAGRAPITALVTEHCSTGGMAIIATHDTPALPCARLRLPPS